MAALAFLFSFVFSLQSFAQSSDETRAKLKQIADAVVKSASFEFIDTESQTKYRAPQSAPDDAVLEVQSRYNDWRWSNGVLNLALLNMAKEFEDPSYEAFVKKNFAFIFDNYGHFKSKDRGEPKFPFVRMIRSEELSDMGPMTAGLVEIYPGDKQERYLLFLKKVADFMAHKSRLKDGTLVSDHPLKWTTESDDLYMSVCFLARMGSQTGEKKYFDDAVKQTLNAFKYLFNEESGLMHHAYFTDNQQPSLAYWGRANGWALLAQVDLLDRLPQNHPKRKELIGLLKKHIIGVSRYQGTQGLWHQLIDKTDSYFETSSSAMFTYAIARAVNKGYIEARYAAVAANGWSGVMTKIQPDGQIAGISLGVNPTLSLPSFYNSPTPLNEVIGIAAVLLAGAEILHLSTK